MIIVGIKFLFDIYNFRLYAQRREIIDVSNQYTSYIFITML